ncbi:MAG TPA: hypothetical protein VMU37_02575 [Caulobacteraceae bacterium]|nr:hypothetical protein [Caulobacteraceae bacterium]
MASPSRHYRRNIAVFVVSLLGHAAGLSYVATMPVQPPTMPVESAGAEPVVLAPRLEPPKLVTRKRRRATPPADVAAREVVVAAAPPLLAAGDPLAAPIPPLASPGGDDPLDLGAAPPTDLTDQVPGAGQYPINPGYWEVAERWLLLSRTERYCVEPWNITRFIAAPCNHLYHCSYPVQRFEAGRFHFEGVVWRHDERYSVSGGGDYSPTSLHVSARFAGHYRFLPLAIGASLDGKYLGADCPSDAKHLRQAGAGANG